MRKVIEPIDVVEDLTKFIEANKTGTQRLSRHTFQPYVLGMENLGSVQNSTSSMLNSAGSIIGIRLNKWTSSPNISNSSSPSTKSLEIEDSDLINHALKSRYTLKSNARSSSMISQSQGTPDNSTSKQIFTISEIPTSSKNNSHASSMNDCEKPSKANELDEKQDKLKIEAEVSSSSQSLRIITQEETPFDTVFSSGQSLSLQNESILLSNNSPILNDIYLPEMPSSLNLSRDIFNQLDESVFTPLKKDAFFLNNIDSTHAEVEIPKDSKLVVGVTEAKTQENNLNMYNTNSGEQSPIIPPPPPSTPFSTDENQIPTPQDRRGSNLTIISPRQKSNSNAPVSLQIPIVLKKRTFTRRTIKMESWLDVLEDPSKGWLRKWVALEGGYIWYFESPADNNKPQGMNRPQSMMSVTKNNIELGVQVSWTIADIQKKFLFTLFAGKKKIIVSASNEEDM
ncbi:hypothetical protein HK096_007820, partial [Nowakowskiella sp. JEL0078]